MYIALRWLVVFSFAMWATLCCFDMLVIRSTKQIFSNDTETNVSQVFVYKNVTVVPERPPPNKQSYQTSLNGLVFLHYLTFIAGALAVTIYNRKADIIVFTRRKILQINTKALKKRLIVTAKKLRGIILNEIAICWKILRRFVLKLLARFTAKKLPSDDHVFNALLLKKLREVGEERNNLSQLLYAAVQENKNIRLQHQLQTMAKNRLSSQIEDTQKQIKEYRTRCMTLQQLYLVTHQENLFLKVRVQKLTQEKQDIEKDFMLLFTEAYQSEDNAIKSYCNRFIVVNKDNRLSSDLGKQIQRLVQKSRYSSASALTWQATRRHNINLDDSKKLPVIEEVDFEVKDQNLSLIKEPTPKLRGLPGEYVWTVKDKDGVIEKLYEYDYGCDFDNGDAIRRIREYTVYHDKDCLLDFMKSTTIIHETCMNENESLLRNSSLEHLANRNFLTGSELFQRFLESNRNVISPAPAPPLLCG